MANKNYNKMSQKPADETAVVAEVTETVEAPKPVYGVVSNCSRLNVRVAPNANAKVIAVINKGEKVEIIQKGSGTTTKFYHVICGKDKQVSFKGFCMRQYITVEQ